MLWSKVLILKVRQLIQKIYSLSRKAHKSHSQEVILVKSTHSIIHQSNRVTKIVETMLKMVNLAPTESHLQSQDHPLL